MIPTYKIDSSKATSKLKRISKNAGSLPWKQVGEIVKQSIQHSFEIGGRYSKAGSIRGGLRKWRARKKRVAWKILRKTGKLKRSIYTQVINNGVKIGSRGLSYNAAQNFGYKKRNLPARPFLVVQKMDMIKAKKLLKEHILK